MTNKLAALWKRNFIPVCVLLICLSTTVVCWQLSIHSEQQEAEHKFAQTAQNYQQLLERRLVTYTSFLNDLSGLFAVDRAVSSQDFETFIRHANIVENYPGTQRIGYLPLVPMQQKAAHEAQMRIAGFTGYKIKSGGLQTEYFPYDYLYPFDASARQSLLGVDEHNEPVRKKALQKARDWNQVIATDKLNKVLVPCRQVSFLLYAPIYTKGLPVQTVAQRRIALKGYVYAAFRAEDLIRAAWGKGFDLIADVRFTAGSDPANSRPLYGSAYSGAEPIRCSQCFKYSGAFQAAGQYWLVELYPRPAFYKAHRESLPLVILFGGLVVSLLLTAISVLISEQRYWSAIQQAQNQQFRSLFEQNPDAVYSFDLKGNFVSANAATLRLTGFTLHELKQMPFARFIVPEQLAASSLRIAHAALGEPAYGETAIHDATGNLVQLSTTNLPIIVNGKVIGIFGIAKDITARKKAEDALRKAHAELEKRVQERTAELYEEVEAHRESEERYRSIFEQAPVGIMHIGLDGKWLQANQKACGIFGYTLDELLLMNYTDINHPEGCEERNTDIRKLRNGEVQTIEREKRFIRKDGTIAWTNVKRSVVHDQVGHPKYILSVIEDITERRQIEEALRISEAGLARAQEIAHLGNWEWDLQNRLTWSDEVYRIFGHHPKELEITYEMFLQRVHSQDRRKLEGALEDAVHERKPYRLDHRILLPDGTERVVHEEAEAIYGETGLPVKMVGTVQDITERKQAEEALRELSSHLQTIREDERTRIAREIHDELGGTLAAIKFDLSLPIRQKDKDFTGASQRNPETIRLVDSAIIALRRIMADLRPSVLDDLGLWAALEWLAQEFQSRMKISTVYRIKGDEVEVDPSQATALFRIAQEALNNVAKHAQASRVTISAMTMDHEVTIHIRDNGRGMTKDQRTKPKSFGIIGMNERAQAFNGTVRIRSRANEGTTVAIRFPITNR